MALKLCAVLAVALLPTVACVDEIPIDDHDEVYLDPRKPAQVTCAASIEWPHVLEGSIDDALGRAVHDGTIVELFAHDPGETVSRKKLEGALARIADRHMPFVTYRQIVEGDAPGGSVALSFDDAAVDDWFAMRTIFARHGALVTFFVSNYDTLTATQRKELRELADDGHDIELHSLHHLAATEYAAVHGVAAYITDEIDPELALMAADGFEPVVFAYPYGYRNKATDAALLERFALLRSVWHECDRER